MFETSTTYPLRLIAAADATVVRARPTAVLAEAFGTVPAPVMRALDMGGRTLRSMDGMMADVLVIAGVIVARGGKSRSVAKRHNDKHNDLMHCFPRPVADGSSTIDRDL